MDAGSAAVIGAVVGGVLGPVGAALNSYLQSRLNKPKPDVVKEARKRLLLRMLNDQWDWRGLDLMAHVIGCDQEATKSLLLEIGAMASEDGKELWGLMSVVLYGKKRDPRYLYNLDFITPPPTEIDK